ncbi:21845_t:CDS:2, partial [Gigaspora margarita]
AEKKLGSQKGSGGYTKKGTSSANRWIANLALHALSSNQEMAIEKEATM